MFSFFLSFLFFFSTTSTRNPTDKSLQVLVHGLFDVVAGEPTADVLLGALLAMRKALLSFQQLLVAGVVPQRQILDEASAARLLNILLHALSHANHNVVTASLEALQQLAKVLKRDLLAWFRAPAICRRCVRRLAFTLAVSGGSAARVSVHALALGCLATIIAYEPALLRLYVPRLAEQAMGTAGLWHCVCVCFFFVFFCSKTNWQLWKATDTAQADNDNDINIDSEFDSKSDINSMPVHVLVSRFLAHSDPMVLLFWSCSSLFFSKHIFFCNCRSAETHIS